MAFQYQRGPQNPYGAPLAPAIPTQSLLAQVLGFTAIGLCITALAAYLTQGFSPGIGLVAMIVGFELQITDLQCKLKLNQHRPESHAALRRTLAAGSADERELLAWMDRLKM